MAIKSNKSKQIQRIVVHYFQGLIVWGAIIMILYQLLSSLSNKRVFSFFKFSDMFM